MWSSLLLSVFLVSSSALSFRISPGRGGEESSEEDGEGRQPSASQLYKWHDVFVSENPRYWNSYLDKLGVLCLTAEKYGRASFHVYEAIKCCNKTSNFGKLQCFKVMQENYFDKCCVRSVLSLTAPVSSCCSKQGQQRYSCFQKNKPECSPKYEFTGRMETVSVEGGEVEAEREASRPRSPVEEAAAVAEVNKRRETAPVEPEIERSSEEEVYEPETETELPQDIFGEALSDNLQLSSDLQRIEEESFLDSESSEEKKMEMFETERSPEQSDSSTSSSSSSSSSSSEEEEDSYFEEIDKNRVGSDPEPSDDSDSEESSSSSAEEEADEDVSAEEEDEEFNSLPEILTEEGLRDLVADFEDDCRRDVFPEDFLPSEEVEDEICQEENGRRKPGQCSKCCKIGAYAGKKFLRPGCPYLQCRRFFMEFYRRHRKCIKRPRVCAFFFVSCCERQHHKELYGRRARGPEPEPPQVEEMEPGVLEMGAEREDEQMVFY